MPQKKYKIALVGYSLGLGGGDKLLANLSIFLNKMGVEVHNIIMVDAVVFPFSGKLVNMGLVKKQRNKLADKCALFFYLRTYFKDNNFDFIIDFRPRTNPIQEYIISRFVYKGKTIATVLSALLEYYMPKNPWLTRLIYAKNYATVATVPKLKALIDQKYHLKNVVFIYNSVNLEEVNIKKNDFVEIDFEYIIAIGQYYDNVKQFDTLIRCYAASILPKNNIHLVILGTGNEDFLIQVAKEHIVDNYIHLLGFESNPYKYLAKAKFLVLTSKNEGFANVLIESLACETPVVAFDCPTGPSLIIKNNQNGLLVENQNLEKLTEAMNLFVENKELYLYCKNNAVESIQQFSLENVGKQWLDLMKININNK